MAGIDGILAVIEVGGLEDRVVVLQGIVPVVVAKRSFWVAKMGRNTTLDRKFGLGDQMMTSLGIRNHPQLFPLKEGGENQFRNIFGQRGDGGKHQCRRATDVQRHGQCFVELFGGKVVKTAALVNLPVNAGGGIVVTLDAVHAEIVTKAVGVFGVHKGKGYKGSPV